MKNAIENIFQQISTVLNNLSEKEYSMPSSILSNASIGQHVRHVIELFMELNKGYETDVVNYEKRKRDYRIETDKFVAAALLTGILNEVDKRDKALKLEAGFSNDTDNIILLHTNYYRELAYNIEHSIHHMALIKVGIKELSTVEVDENFGIASATIKYRQSCVQ